MAIETAAYDPVTPVVISGAVAPGNVIPWIVSNVPFLWRAAVSVGKLTTILALARVPVVNAVLTRTIAI